MKAKDVMTTRVLSVPAGASIIQAARLMLHNRISGLPVVDAAGHLVGIVSEGDFLRRGEFGAQRRRPRWLEFLIGPGRLATEYIRACGRRVDEIMTRELHTITEDTSLADVVQMMERHKVKRLPVVRGGQLVGIVTRANLLHAVASLARTSKPARTNDAAIRQRIMDELNRWSWAPHAMLNIVVWDGIVDLWGSIPDEQERRALIVAAETVPGVKQVRDHLVLVRPLSALAVLPSADEPARTKAS